MPDYVSVDALPEYVGKDLGPSDWFLVDQDRIDQFADATADHQFIHTDPDRAKETPFGATIAHGYLTLSLLPKLTRDLGIMPENMKMGLNYGLNKVRFLQPVKVDSELRARVTLRKVSEKGPGQILLAFDVAVEIRGEEKPALIAETLALCVL